MINTRLLTAAALGLGLLALPTVGDAQSTGGQATGARSNAPVSYGADSGEYTATGLSLRGRAEIIQGDNRIRANRIDGVLSGGNLVSVDASGEVYFVTPNQTIRGDRASYTLSTEIVVVTGDVILTQGENVLTGSRLTYNVQTGAARIEGGSGGRVRGVFHPQGN